MKAAYTTFCKITGMIIIVWLLPFNDSHCQELGNFSNLTWQGKDSLITSLYSGGAQSLAYVFITHAYNSERSQPNINPKALSVFANWMGILYLSENHPDSASPYLAESLRLYDEYPEIKDTLYAQVLINSFISANALGNFSIALEHLKSAVKYMEAVELKDWWRLENLFRLIEYEIKNGSTDSAEIYSRKAISFASENYGNSSSDYLIALSWLGRVFQNQGRTRQSVNLITQAYNLAKVQLDSNDLIIIQLGIYAAGIQHNIGNLNDALRIYREILDRCELYPEMQQSELYPEILTRIGLLSGEMENYDESYEYLSRADILLTLRREKYDPVHINSQVNMGDILFKRGQVIEAEQYYQNALDQTQVVYGEEHRAVSFIYDKLGNLYQTTNEFEKALDVFSISKDIIYQIMGNGHPSYGTALRNIARTYRAMGNDSMAFKKLEEAYFVFQDQHGRFNRDIFEMLYELSRMESFSGPETFRWLLEGAKYINRARNEYRFLSINERNYLKKQIEEYLSFSCTKMSDSNLADRVLIDEIYDLYCFQGQIDWLINPVDLIPFVKINSSNYSKTALEWQHIANSILEASSVHNWEKGSSGHLDSLEQAAAKKLVEVLPPILSMQSNLPDKHVSPAKGDAWIDLSLLYRYDSTNQHLSDEPGILIFIRSGGNPNLHLSTFDLNREALSGVNYIGIDSYEKWLPDFWQHLEGHLIGTDRIIFNARSSLFMLPFETIRDNEGLLIEDKYEIVRITGWSEHQNSLTVRPTHTTALSVSGCKYDESPVSRDISVAPDMGAAPVFDFRDSLIDSKRIPVKFASGLETSNRISSVTENLRKKKWQVYELNGSTAKEDILREKLKAQPHDLVIFDVQLFSYNDITDSESAPFILRSMKANRLLRSGFVLTGAGNFVQGGSAGDGLISNMELTALPLQGVGLAIMVIDFNGIKLHEKEDLAFHVPEVLKRAGVGRILIVNRGSPTPVINDFFKFFLKKYLKNGSVSEAYYSGINRLRKKQTSEARAGFLLIK